MRFVSSSLAVHRHLTSTTTTTTSGPLWATTTIKWVLLVVYVIFCLQVQVSGSDATWEGALHERGRKPQVPLEGLPIDVDGLHGKGKQWWLFHHEDYLMAMLQESLDPDCGRVPLLTQLHLWPGNGSCNKPTIKPTRPPEAGLRTNLDDQSMSDDNHKGNMKNNNNKKKLEHKREKRFANTKIVDYGLFPSVVEVRSGFKSATGSTYWTNVCNGVIIGKREVITEVSCIRNRGDDENTPIIGINMYRTPENRTDQPQRTVHLKRPMRVCVSQRWREAISDGWRYPDDRIAILHFEDDFHWDDYTQSACLPWGRYRFAQLRHTYMVSFGLDGIFRVSNEELDGDHTLRMAAMGPFRDCPDVIKPKRPGEKFFQNQTTLKCAYFNNRLPPGWGYFCNDGHVSDAGAPLLTMVDNRVVLRAIVVSGRFSINTPDCNPDVGNLAFKLGPTVVNDIFESVSEGDLYKALICKEDNMYQPWPPTTTAPNQ